MGGCKDMRARQGGEAKVKAKKRSIYKFTNDSNILAGLME
jgi:hypothetical protein